jgi:tetratricopeptide (TPR) repeat protein
VSLVEELVEFLRAEAPFFEESALDEALAEKDRPQPYPLKLLSGYIDDKLGLEPGRKQTLTSDQRRQVFDALAAELYARLSFRTYEALRGSGEAARRALEFADQARHLDPENPRHELVAARFLLLGEYFDEVAATVARVQRSARSRDPEIQAEVEEIKKILDERDENRPVGRLRDAPRPGGPAALFSSDDLAALESEIERFPSSIQAYEELARALASWGQMAEAVGWSEQAIAQCLAREPQLRARSLNLEMSGLSVLATRDPNAVRLYLARVHRPALEIIESIPPTDPQPYPVDYLLGHCRLAVNRPEEARAAFERALVRCTRQLHRTVLRGLASDVDGAYLAVARRAIQDKLEVRAFADALVEAAEIMGRLRRKEAALVDLARVQLDAATAHLGSDAECLPIPPLPEVDDWSGRLADCFAAPTDLGRARRLVELGLERDELGRKALELLLQKVEALERQAVVAAALAESGTLLRNGRFEAALAALEAAGPARENEPRILRQQALLLLKLDRFDEADAVAARLKSQSSPVAREFAASYPSMLFRQRMGAGIRLIRAGDSEAALQVFEPAVATTPDEVLELAYGRGFALAMDGFRLKNQRRRDESRRRLAEALRQIDGHVSAARAANHARLLELYATLDKELDT